jgi:general secretion pathway protein D
VRRFVIAERRQGKPREGAAGRLVVLTLLVLAALLPACRLAAETQTPPLPAVLTGVSAADQGGGQSAVVLTFSPVAPKYSIINNDSDKPSIAFALSSRGLSASAPADLHGLLRSVVFDQNDTVLILHFSTAAKAHVTVTPVGTNAISLTIAPEAPAAEPVAADEPGGLPAGEDRAPGDDGFEIVFLKYADVSEVVGLLTEGLSVKSNDSFVPHEPAFGSAGMGGATFAPAPADSDEPSTDPMAQSVDDSIAVDRRLNAIILKGSPERIARLKEKIAQIDVPVDSVLLETIFVELDESGAKNVGLNFNNANSQVAVATFQTGAFIPAGEPSEHPLTSVSLQAAIAAQVQSGHGRIVSKPRIAAQSGSTAKIITGDALPILTSIALSGVNAVSQQVQYVNVGVTLQIAPRVSSDGFVTSHIFCVVSSVTGTSQGYPTISQREAETSATVRDGETFVIGGLTEESDITSNTDLPGIGKVPVLRDLLGMRTGTRSKTELYIVVTPHVVRRADALAAAPAEALLAK